MVKQRILDEEVKQHARRCEATHQKGMNVKSTPDDKDQVTLKKFVSEYHRWCGKKGHMKKDHWPKVPNESYVSTGSIGVNFMVGP